jgi:hypothetical protein
MRVWTLSVITGSVNISNGKLRRKMICENQEK